MATEDQHPHVVKPDLSDTNPVESVDLRSKSLPPQNFLLLAVDEGVTQRSCSANGASPYDKDAEAAYSNNTITNRPREKKTAFENSNSSDESRPYENGAGRRCESIRLNNLTFFFCSYFSCSSSSVLLLLLMVQALFFFCC